MKIKVNKLKGRLLDYAVALAIGYAPGEPLLGSDGKVVLGYHENFYWYGTKVEGNALLVAHHLDFTPSTCWAQGGPLLDSVQMDLTTCYLGARLKYLATIPGFVMPGITGETLLIAGLKCLVSLKLGNEVDIPEQLIGETI